MSIVFGFNGCSHSNCGGFLTERHGQLTNEILALKQARLESSYRGIRRGCLPDGNFVEETRVDRFWGLL